MEGALNFLETCTVMIYFRHASLGAHTSAFRVALSSLTNNRGEMGEKKALVHIL